MRWTAGEVRAGWGKACPGRARGGMMLRIPWLTGDAGEALGNDCAKFRLEESWQVLVAEPQRRAFLSVVHAFGPGFASFTENSGYRVGVDPGFDEVGPEEFDALVFPGDRAPMDLRSKPKAVAIVCYFVAISWPIAANCHVPYF